MSFRIFVGFFLADYLYVRHFSSPSCPVFSLQCHLCSFWLLLFIGWANSVWSSFYFQLFLLPSPKNKLFAPLLTSGISGKIDLPAKHLWYELRLFPLCLFLELLRRWWQQREKRVRMNALTEWWKERQRERGSNAKYIVIRRIINFFLQWLSPRKRNRQISGSDNVNSIF